MAGIATICWDFVPGSVSTLVEYRVSGDTTWIQPTSPNNPTLTNCYPLSINDNIFYDVRLTTNGISCGPKSTTFQIFLAQGACCPPGYTLSDDETYCYQINTTAATPPSSPENTVAKQNANYGRYGTLIYDPGYNIDGSGTAIMINPSNTFWVNGVGYPSGGGATVGAGPCNRTGLWATTLASDQDVGFTVCVNAPTDGTYYIGCFADNYIVIDVDGVNILTMNESAMSAFLNTHGFPGQDAQVTFRWWHVYPVSLTAGFHVLNILGHNVSSAAAMGVEVYNMTSAQIQSATSYGAMGSGLVFSSKDFIGQPVQIGTGGSGYTCPSGYSLVLCDGPAYCTQTLITAPIECTTTTTTTTTTSTTTTTTTTSVPTLLRVINNSGTALQVTNVIVASPSSGTTGFTFPISDGDNQVASVDNGAGTYTVSIVLTSSTGWGSLNIVDSASTLSCVDGGSGSSPLFSSQVMNTSAETVVTIFPVGTPC